MYLLVIVLSLVYYPTYPIIFKRIWFVLSISTVNVLNYLSYSDKLCIKMFRCAV